LAQAVPYPYLCCCCFALVAAMAALLGGSDNFFAAEPNLVATFDIDYDLVIDFKKKVQWVGLGICFPVFSLCGVPCIIKQNLEWSTRSQHVALTQDGIKFIVDKHKSGCGFSCQDAGKVSKTVPYDKITDCDIEEPAGTACCCCIQNVITKVNIETAASRFPELVLEGLKDSHDFKKKVWDMKAGRAGPVARSSSGQMAPAQQDMNSALLQKIYDELRQLNATMANSKPDSGCTGR